MSAVTGERCSVTGIGRNSGWWWQTAAASRPLGCVPTEADRGGGSEAAAATGRSGHGLASVDPVGAGSLCEDRLQRPPGLPGRDRPADRADRQSAYGEALCEGRVVADHPRVWAWHQSISDPEYRAAAKVLRRKRAEVLRPLAETGAHIEVEHRSLSDYDTALRLDLDGGVA